MLNGGLNTVVPWKAEFNMKPQIDKKFFNEEEIRTLIWGLYDKARKLKIDEVVGIARGGLHISEPLAKMLGKPHSSIYLSFYNGEKRRRKPILKMSSELDKNKTYLVCDDMIDNGNTMDYFFKNVAKDISCKSAVLFYNPDNAKKFVPDIWIMYKPKQWVVFPWGD